jgi:hypothetical protein
MDHGEDVGHHNVQKNRANVEEGPPEPPYPATLVAMLVAMHDGAVVVAELIYLRRRVVH